MRHLVGIIAASAAIIAVGTGCGSTAGKSTSVAPSSSPSVSTSSGVSPKPKPAPTPAPSPTVPTYKATGGRVTLVGGLSIPLMEGWKVELNNKTNTIMTDRSKACVFNSKPGGASCPVIMVRHYDGTDISTLVKGRYPCNVFVPITDKPAGSDRIAGVLTSRYRANLGDCKAKGMIIPPGLDLAVTSAFWYPKHHGDQIAIIAIDGNNGPRIDVKKVAVALRQGRWTS